MQRLLFLKLASSNFCKNLANNANSSPLFCQTHRTFTSLTKSTHHNYGQQYHLFGFSQSKSIHHFYCCPLSPHEFSGKVHGFLSNPLVSKQFLSNLSNTHFKFLRKRLTDCRFGIVNSRFARGFSGFNASFGSSGRSWRGWLHRLAPDDMVLGLIVANVAVFMLWRIVDQQFMMKNFMISLDNFRSGRVHTLITSAFSHIDIEHIISNMIGLYFFGMNTARTFGPEYLLKLYVAGAIGGSLLYLVHHAFLASSTKGQGMFVKDPSRTPGLGASGAVNAIMLLDIFLNPRATLYFDFIIPVPAILLGIFLIGKDVLRIVEGNSNISGSAHLGGAAVAAIAYARIKKGRRY